MTLTIIAICLRFRAMLFVWRESVEKVMLKIDTPCTAENELEVEKRQNHESRLGDLALAIQPQNCKFVTSKCTKGQEQTRHAGETCRKSQGLPRS